MRWEEGGGDAKGGSEVRGGAEEEGGGNGTFDFIFGGKEGKEENGLGSPSLLSRVGGSVCFQQVRRRRREKQEEGSLDCGEGGEKGRDRLGKKRGGRREGGSGVEQKVGGRRKRER